MYETDERLSQEEIDKLLKNPAQNKQTIVQAMTGYAQKFVNIQYPNDQFQEDLIQSALLWIAYAVDKYDDKKGSFMGLAWWEMKWQCEEFKLNRLGVDSNTRRLYARYLEAIRKLTEENAELSLSNICDKGGLSESSVLAVVGLNRFVRLDGNPIEGGDTIHELIKWEEPPSTYMIDDLKKNLTKKEFKIIKSIYRDWQTETEVAKELDTSQQNINKIKQQIIEKLIAIYEINR